jgi:hypothetical protein
MAGERQNQKDMTMTAKNENRIALVMDYAARLIEAVHDTSAEATSLEESLACMVDLAVAVNCLHSVLVMMLQK